MIWAAKQRIDEISAPLRGALEERMEADTAQRIHAAQIPGKGFAMAAGRDLAKRLAASVLDVVPEAVRLRHEAGGRPFLTVTMPGRKEHARKPVFLMPPRAGTDDANGMHPLCSGAADAAPASSSGMDGCGLHVTLSHSKEWLLAAVSDAPVACDIQEVRRFPLQAVKGFFSKEDYRFIESAADPDKVLCKLWCRRECFIKLFGPQHYSVGIPLCETKLLFQKYGIFFFEEQPEEGVCLALAWPAAKQAAGPGPALSGSGIIWRAV